MEEEEILKMEFINENIIEKGIDLEDITNFVKKETNEDFDSLSLSKLEDMLNLFNKSKEKETKSSDNQKEENKKEEEHKEPEKEKTKDIQEKAPKEIPKESQNLTEQPKKKDETKQKPNPQVKKEIISFNNQDALYSPEEYEFKTDTQQKNKLIELCNNNNIISVIVSEPKKMPGGFFSKNICSYRVQCQQLNSDVRRTYDDFEWFRNQLFIRYPLRLIPPVMKESIFKQIGNMLKIESEDIIEQRKIRYLNKFINAILKKKILKTSPIFHEFLCLSDDRFKKYRNKLDSKKYELDIPLRHLITMKGKIKCSLENNSIEEANKMVNKYSSLSGLYIKLDSSINNVINDLNNLNKNMNEVSICFNLLYENLRENNYKNVDNISKNFTELKYMFNNWSMTISKQSDFFNKEFKEYFSYMALEVNEISSIYKKYIEFKKEYEEFSSIINKRKEDLYNSQNYDKWDIHPSKQNDLNTFKLNKKLAFENMLYKENLLLKEEKKRVCVTITKMKRQYDKLMKIHDGKIQNIYDSLKKSIKIGFDVEENAV